MIKSLKVTQKIQPALNFYFKYVLCTLCKYVLLTKLISNNYILDSKLLSIQLEYLTDNCPFKFKCVLKIPK